MPQDKTVIVRGSYLGILHFIIAGAVGIGSFLAYSESKYASKEAITIEVDQRKNDVVDLKHMMLEQSKKLDRIFDILIERRK